MPRTANLLRLVRRRSTAIIRGCVLVAILLSPAGCASWFGNKPPPQRQVSASRRFENYLLKPSSKRNCPLTIVREAGITGAGLSVYLDGDRVARLIAGDTITFYLRPGRHLVGIRPLFSPAVSRRLALQRGEPRALRIVDQNGNYQLKIADRGWLDTIGRTLHLSRQ